MLLINVCNSKSVNFGEFNLRVTCCCVGSSLRAAVVAVRFRHVSELQRRLEHSSLASGSPAADPQPLLVNRESCDHAHAHTALL